MDRKATYGHFIAVASAWATLFAFIELWKAMRSSLWTGMSLDFGVELGKGWLIYALIIGLVTLAGSRKRTTESVAVTAMAVAVALWFTLTMFDVPMRGSMTIYIGIAIMAVGAVNFISQRSGAAPWSPYFALILGAVAGMDTAVLLDDAFFLRDERLSYVSSLSVLVFGFVWIGCLGNGWKQPKKFIVPAAVIITLPFVVNILTQWTGQRDYDDRPNVILITIDTLRADYCSLYGGDVPTPNLERLAEGGATFDWSITLAPWTLPSLTGMFASNYPAGVTPFGRMEDFPDGVVSYRVPKSVPTLAEMLREEGYTTAAVVSNPLMRDATGVNRGFDTYRLIGHRTRVYRGPLHRLPILGSVMREAGLWHDNMHPVDTTEFVTRFAERFLSRNRDPYFLWLHYMDPHMPYDPPHRFRNNWEPWRVFSAGDNYWKGPPLDENKNVVLDEYEQDYVRHLYEGEIRYVDEALGRVLDTVNDENVFWLLTSDHGEELWDHGRFAHGFTMYNEQLRVPAILAGPDINEARIARPVSQIDFIPTLADVLGIEAPEAWRGVSLMPLIREGGKATPPFALANNPWTSEEPYQAAYNGEYKYIRGMESNSRELFNIIEDPTEQTNIAEDQPSIVDTFEALLNEWQDTFPSTFEELRKNTPLQKDDELQEQLESMGYL